MKKGKRYLSRLVCICLFLQILCNPISASELEKQPLDGNTPVPNASNFISQQTIGNKKVSSISQVGLKRYRNILSKQNLSESKINSEILESMGFNVTSMPQEEIDYILSNAVDITVSESFIQVNQNGDMLELSEAECMKKVSEELQERKVNKEMDKDTQDNIETSMGTLSNDGSNTETSADGYMRIITAAYYISPASSGEKGWYNVSASYEWLITPNYRMIDAMSLYASNCAWSQSSNDYYSYFSYKERFVTTGGTQDVNYRTVSSNDRVIKTTGVYFTYDLPNDSGNVSWYRYSEFYFYMRGKVRISDFMNPRAFNVFSRYEHVYSSINVQPSFGWSSSDPYGVSANIGVSLVNNVDSFYSMCYVSYNPNIYK